MKKLEPDKPSPPAKPARDRPAVLYVEDEDANWRIAAKALAERYDLRRAVDARSTFEALRAQPFRAILMDIQLSDSELNGIEIVRFLRGDTTMKPPEGAAGFVLRPLPPIIFVTAYAARYTKEELVRIGADDVVTKPLDLAKLHLAITRAIASSATAALNRASQSRRATEPASSSNTSGAASRAAELPLGATQNGTAKPR